MKKVDKRKLILSGSLRIELLKKNMMSCLNLKSIN